MPAKNKATVTKRGPAPLAPLVAEVRSLIQSARRPAASTVNTLQVLTNFEIGRRIVEHEQKGAIWAEGGSTMKLDSLQRRLVNDDLCEENHHA